MDNQKKEENGREGRLPAMAPLANPYVPFQLENPPQYEAQKGLVRGTLFPGLDLPFMGMVNLNELPETPSSQMQALPLPFRSWRCIWTPTGTTGRRWSCTAAISSFWKRCGRNIRNGLAP